MFWAWCWMWQLWGYLVVTVLLVSVVAGVDFSVEIVVILGAPPLDIAAYL